MKERIFVAIASYLDYELPYTILDCISKADSPELLDFGICLQYDKSPKTNSKIIDFLCDKFPIQVSKYNYKQSEGGCWARQIAQTFFNNQKYSLQVDSHTRFINGWDTIVKNDYNKLLKNGIDKPLITFLPPPYMRDDDKGIDLSFKYLDNLDRLNVPIFKHMSDEYWLVYQGYGDEINTNFQCTQMKILYGGFVFTDGNWVKEVEQDPEHYYTGEELALTIRSYTYGYDLYTPSQIVAWHRSHSYTPKKHYNNNPDATSKRKHSHAIERLKKLIFNEDLGKYGAGNVRTLKEYEKYAGLNFKEKLIFNE